MSLIYLAHWLLHPKLWECRVGAASDRSLSTLTWKLHAVAADAHILPPLHWGLVTVEAVWRWTSHHVPEISLLKSVELCPLHSAGSSHQKGTANANANNDAQWVLKGPKCAKMKHYRTISTGIKSGWIQASMLLRPNSDPVQPKVTAGWLWCCGNPTGSAVIWWDQPVVFRIFYGVYQACRLHI